MPSHSPNSNQHTSSFLPLHCIWNERRYWDSADCQPQWSSVHWEKTHKVPGPIWAESPRWTVRKWSQGKTCKWVLYHLPCLRSYNIPRWPSLTSHMNLDTWSQDICDMSVASLLMLSQNEVWFPGRPSESWNTSNTNNPILLFIWSQERTGWMLSHYQKLR